MLKMGPRANAKRVSTPLVQKFFDMVDREGILHTGLLRAAGYDDKTTNRWGQGRDPRLSTFETCVNAAGYEIVLVKREGPSDKVLRADTLANRARGLTP